MAALGAARHSHNCVSTAEDPSYRLLDDLDGHLLGVNYAQFGHGRLDGDLYGPAFYFDVLHLFYLLYFLRRRRLRCDTDWLARAGFGLDVVASSSALSVDVTVGLGS